MSADAHLRAKLVVCLPKADGASRTCREFDGALVDTGATHTTISAAAANALGLRGGTATTARLADGRQVSGRIVDARVCLGNAAKPRDAVCHDAPVTVLDGAVRPLVGQSTLRALKAQLDVGAGTLSAHGQVATQED